MIVLINYNEENYKSSSNMSGYLNVIFMEVNHNKYLYRVNHVLLTEAGSCNNQVFKL